LLKRPTDPHQTEAFEEESKVAPWSIRQTWLGVGLTMIPWIALALALNSLGNSTSSSAPLSFRVDLLNAIITLIFSALIEGAFLIAPFYFANAAFRSLPRHTRQVFHALGFRKSTLGRAIGYILGFMLLIFVINYVYSVAITTFHLNLQTNDQVILARSKQAPITTYATLFAAVFIAPFCEEIFFRGFVFPGLLKAMPVGAAIVLSSLLFAVAHADPGSFIVLLVIGLALAFVRWRTNSIWPGMALHMLNNAIGALSILLVMWGVMKP
jgi:membrane protease YdiL (CAAX protease family)